ncbi:MAG: antibiotic biosynthesis monooxygenase, partial [Mycobacteriaceae bacterium]|nr:antibiotic biosynthesis monooxygenase [Mycobacteriaceae bacterium]
YPGFIGAEITAPTAVQPDWVVIYRFDSLANLGAWINSAARQDRLATGEQYFDGPATQQVLGGVAKPVDQLVTVVVTHRVDPEHVEEFLAWQNRLQLAESRFEGYRGSELFRPIEGMQDSWTAMYRYNTAADLDTWLTSRERKQLLKEGKQFRDFDLRTVDSSFGSWFAFDDDGAETKPPSDLKTSIAVWVGLYPTVVLLTLAQFPLRLPLWLGMLVGNLLSSMVMTFLTMPYYVNPLLKNWLQLPAGARTTRANLRGIAIIVALMVCWAVFFWLLTTRIWSTTRS